MKVLALETELQALPPEAKDLLHEEARVLWELSMEGIVRESYFRADRHEAVLMLEVLDPDQAQAFLGRLPLVRDGFIRFDLLPLVPYDGFARLFGNPTGRCSKVR